MRPTPPAGGSSGTERNGTATSSSVKADGSEKEFAVDVRVDTPQEVEYYRSGGILPYVLRQLAN